MGWHDTSPHLRAEDAAGWGKTVAPHHFLWGTGIPPSLCIMPGCSCVPTVTALFSFASLVPMRAWEGGDLTARVKLELENPVGSRHFGEKEEKQKVLGGLGCPGEMLGGQPVPIGIPRSLHPKATPEPTSSTRSILGPGGGAGGGGRAQEGSLTASTGEM